ncbi:enoyl-CoA hydratase/isomerase family protein [Cryobacterium melibiosiphilum]|uniref:Enoyl-CoA hydratase/isomerase family protein n=1 Tax=Cryobacterium melibiosiphilum TaxID=995039 RepID=A0A3A5MHZ9_9MICO|nr:enoyl-CoA hydratase/isomerase family protein [Cryobacterium melibiosiphilum]RJT89032.1 enoyl-CoA hydratase/isomerase family protein [Cryobacterium melibiosiphilum]
MQSPGAPVGAPGEFVSYTRAGGVAVIRLNRPDRLNAASPELVTDFKRAIERAIAERAVVAIITGEGRAFCAGHDLKAEALAPDSPQALDHLHQLQDITRLLRSAAIISIAAVHGYALGAGLEFALSCDFIVADEHTRFGFPEVSVGLSVTGGISFLLPQAVGLPMAKELILLGEPFGAERALALGLINRVTGPGRLLPVAHDIADRLQQKPRHALALAKESFESALRSDVETAMALEIENALLTGDSTDAEAARTEFATNGQA